MFLRKQKEYYPLEIEQILGKKEAILYDRSARGKSYCYIAIENSKNQGET